MEPEPTRSSQPSRSDAAERIRVVAIDPVGTPVEVADLDAFEAACRDPSLRFWLDATNPGAGTVERIASIIGLHPIVAENIAERHQRSKAERIDGALHVVLFALRYEGEVVEFELDFFLSDRSLFTVHDSGWDPFTAPLLRTGVEQLLADGPDYLFYAIADSVVDGYFPVLDRLTDEIDEVQDQVLERRSSWTLQRLFVLKRELIRLRRATSPTREIFNQLTNRELGLIAPKHVIYFRDVYDHLIRVTDELDTYRELVSGTLDIYLTSVNNDLSNIMKRLTGVTVILAGIGAVAGIFGMSEAGLAFSGGEAMGFWIVAFVTVLGAAAVTLFLRRIDWI